LATVGETSLRRRFFVAMSVKKYLINICIAFDQFINTLLGGDPDETISSRLGKFKDQVALYAWLCLLLDYIDPGHCRKAIEPDEGKDQLLPFAQSLPGRLLLQRWKRGQRD